MRKFALVTVGLLIPVAALALDFTDISSRYTDAPFSQPEAAGISVLTSIKAVQGNPDGSFRAQSSINRAEFLKIAYLSSFTIVPTSTASRGCFPDAQAQDWFWSYVCAARKAGIVKGFNDGLFHPERPVTYAEALKMLSLLHGYDISALVAGEEWFLPYVRAAQVHKVLLPTSTGYNDPLTRGEMARLAASFTAKAQGELEIYRDAEQGKRRSSVASSSSSSSGSSVSSASSSVSSVGSSSSASSVSSSSSSSVSSVSALPIFPARSHFLVIGKRTQPIISSPFTIASENAYVRIAKVKMKKKIVSFDSLILLDSTGKDIGILRLDPSDLTDKTWKGIFTDSTYMLTKGQERMIGVAAQMKTNAAGGNSEDLVQADTFSITVVGVDSGTSTDLPSTVLVYPQHQTALGEILGVRNVLKEEDSLVFGQNQLLGAFAFSGSVLPPGVLAITSLEFKINKSSSLAVSNWQIGTQDSVTRAFCSVSDITLTCGNIPDDLGTLLSGGRVLRLYADVTLDQGGKNPFLQISLDNAGTLGAGGSVRWTDNSGDFNWIDLPTLAKGTMWK